MERLSDDTLLEVLRWVPELPYWAACELVSQRWCALLRRSRTRVVLSHGQHTRAAFDEALCAAQRSDLPQVELRVSAVLRSDRGYGDERVPPPLWDAAVQRQLEELGQAAHPREHVHLLCAILERLRLGGRIVFCLPACLTTFLTQIYHFQ